MEVVKLDRRRRALGRRRTTSDKALSITMRAITQIFTLPKLITLINSLDERDQLYFYTSYIKPLPPEREKDVLDRLSDEDIDRVVAGCMKQSRRVI
jgi:hypothetical protein